MQFNNIFLVLKCIPGKPVVNNVWEEKIQYQKQEESNDFLQLQLLLDYTFGLFESPLTNIIQFLHAVFH